MRIAAFVMVCGFLWALPKLVRADEGGTAPVYHFDPATAHTPDSRAALAALDARERKLRATLAEHPLLVPGLFVGIGVPGVLSLVPVGAALMADGAYESYRPEIAIGAVILTAGVVAAAATVWGAIAIRKRRRQVRLDEYELRAIAVQRVLLEHGVEPSAPARAASWEDLPSPRRRGPSWTSRGRMILTGGLSGSFNASQGAGRHWDLELSPGFAYFLRDALALGAFLTLGMRDAQLGHGQTSQDWTLSGGVRLIRTIPLAKRMSLWFWPYAKISWSRNHYETRNEGLPALASSSSRMLLSAGVQLPLMFQLSESWGVGLGPQLEYSYDRTGADAVQAGIASQLIGSF